MTEETLYYFFRLNDFGKEYAIKITPICINTEIMKSFREMTENQKQFYLQHPYASIREIVNCELYPPYVPPEEPIETTRENAIKRLDTASRYTIGTFVDNLAFANAVATSIFSKSKGITPIYEDHEILSTAVNFLEKGKLCRNKMQEITPLIEKSDSKEEIESMVNETLEYFEIVQSDADNIEKHRSAKLQEIDVYDNSDAVNGFYYNGNFMWLDKSTRVGLVNTLNSAEELQRETVNIWYNNQVCIELDVQTARMMLAAIELYATDCYNVTASHKKIVMGLESIEDIDDFDITADYPEMLRFGEE